MNLRAFYRKYGVELIPAATENLTLGKCVWDGGWLDSPSFTHPSMPDYIYNTFVQKNIITVDQCEAILSEMRSLPKIEAEFAQYDIEFEIEDVLSLKIAKQIGLDANFDLKKVSSFTITDSLGISMPNRDRLIIDKMLDQIKENHWSEYRSGLRRAYMITELFYGKLEITIDTDIEANFELALPKEQLDTSNKFKMGRSISYSFQSSKVPFAMRIERIKHFNT